MSIQEIERAIATVPLEEARRLRRLLDRRLAQEGARPEEAAEYEPVPYERIAHLSGVFKGGPTDLASNKRYLEGLGERSMR